MADEPLIPLGGDITNEQVQQTECPLSPQSGTGVTIIQCYAKGRPTPVDVHQKFATFLADIIGEQSPRWRFSPEALPETHKAHRDIFPVQVRAELELNSGQPAGDEDFEDLRTILRDQISRFFQESDATPLLLLFSAPERDKDVQKGYTGAELLAGFAGSRKDGGIASGGSSGVEAMLESFWTVGGISLIAFSCYKGLENLGESSAPNSKTDEPKSPSDTMKTTAKEVKDWVEVVSGFASFIKQSSTPLWNRQKLQSITQARRQLLDNCSQMETELSALEGRMKDLFNLSHRSMNTSLSTQEILEVAQLLMHVSNSQLQKKQTLIGLFPLLEKEYSGKKTASHGVTAVAGGAVALYTAVACLGPAGWSMWGAAWLVNHAIASMCIGSAGLATAGVCGVMSATNNSQCKMRDNVRANDERVKKSRSQFVVWLVIHLVGKEQFETLSSQERSDIYQQMGIQSDLVSSPDYQRGGLKTAWEEFSDAANQYLKSCKELTESSE